MAHYIFSVISIDFLWTFAHKNRNIVNFLCHFGHFEAKAVQKPRRVLLLVYFHLLLSHSLTAKSQQTPPTSPAATKARPPNPSFGSILA
jgi:hypothetical protein